MSRKKLAAGVLVLMIVVTIAFAVIYWLVLRRTSNVGAMAREGDWIRVVATLDAHPWLSDLRDSEGRNALFYVEDADIAKLLIDCEAEVNAQDIYGFTPLHTVREPEVARVLLENGADTEARTASPYGYTPLHTSVNPSCLSAHSVFRGKKEVPEKDQYDFEVVPDEYEITRRIQKCQVLVEFGADINAQNYEDATPLDITSSVFSRLEEWLIDHGAVHVNHRDWGKAPPP